MEVIYEYCFPNRLPLAVFEDDCEEDVDTFIHVMNNYLNTTAERIPHVKISNYLNVIHGYTDEDFVMHFRLGRNATYSLVKKFEFCSTYKELQESPGRSPLSAELHILSLLWFAGHEAAGYRDVADRFGITISSLFNVLSRTMKFICEMEPPLIRLPTNGEKDATEKHFREKKGFPGIIGCIDGSHVRINKPKQCGDSYINRKKYFSVQLQGLVDHENKFLHLHVGFPGRVHDARVFRESALPNLLPGLCTDGRYILGDSAYPCLPYLITPYKRTTSFTRQKMKFNKKLSGCRVVVEHTFGALKQRFRQLYNCKIRSIPRLIQFITVCCMLHNIGNSKDLKIFEPAIDDQTPDPEAQRILSNIGEDFHNDLDIDEGNCSGKAVRDHLCNELVPLPIQGV